MNPQPPICIKHNEAKVFKPYQYRPMRWKCMSCQNEATHKWRVNNPVKAHAKMLRNCQSRRVRNQAFVDAYLSNHPCVDCGESDILVLQFDHVRGMKSFNISHKVKQGGTTKLLTAEIAKCDVRCANCHQRKTTRDSRLKSKE